VGARATLSQPELDRPSFVLEVDRGVAEANATVAGYLFAAAKAGNIAAIIFWLKTRDARDPDGTNINLAIGVDAARPGQWCRIAPLLSLPAALEIPPRYSRLGSSLIFDRVHWVRPEWMVEVKYLICTSDHRLCQVVYDGWRGERPAADGGSSHVAAEIWNPGPPRRRE
jgi:hypothetical protein